MTNMTHSYDESVLSDLHKEARGFRPREGFWNHWNLSTHDEKEEIWNGLIRESDLQDQLEKEAQDRAMADFEQRVGQAIMAGAADRATAIRWILQAEDLENAESDEICYRLGLPYNKADIFK